MDYRYLGKSGLLVSELTLGTMTFGAGKWGCEQEEAHRIMAQYLEAGGNMIDCADVYAGGESECIVGSWMPRILRDDVIIATKCNFPFGTSMNNIGSTRKHLVTSCESSLKRLKTDYIDIFYLHRPDPSAPVEEVMETLELLMRQGKILYSACSNFPAWRIMLNQGEARRRNTSGFICGQYMHNLVDRTCEEEIIPAMVHQGIGILCWSPLAGGLLTGKYQGAKDAPADSRFTYRKKRDIPRFWHEHGLRIAEGVMKISQSSGISPIALAYGWLLKQEYISSVIMGVRNTDQMQEILQAREIDLPEAVHEALDQLSAPEKTYLWSFNDETNGVFRTRGKLFPGTVIV